MDRGNQSANCLEMDKSRQLDLFLATADDPPLRDNRDVMEHPFLALQKRRVKPIRYANGNVHLRVSDDIEYGIATIWDWDIIIGLSAHINDAVERNLPTTPHICFVPYNLLHSIGRATSGREYRNLAMAVRRLRMTTMITNVRHEDGAGEERPFSWLADYSIPKRYTSGAITPDEPHGEPDPARPWEVELPPWLYRAILSRKGILAVHPDYFQLTGGIERWLYRLAGSVALSGGPRAGRGGAPATIPSGEHRP